MVKKSLFPQVAEENVDLSGIDLSKYERCPLCGRKLKYSVTDEKLSANRENLKKRKEKGGRPRSVDRPPDKQQEASCGGGHAYTRVSKTTTVPKKS